MLSKLKKIIAGTPSLMFEAGFAPLNPQFKSITGEGLGASLSGMFSGNFVNFANTAFRAAIAIGAMLAVLQLVRAGFMYMTSDVWSDKSRATEIMQNAVTGLLILLAIWLILYQINPQILNLDILQNAPQVGSTPAQSGSIGCDPLKGCP